MTNITSKSLVNETLTVIVNNGENILTAKKDHPKWTEIIEAFKIGNDTLLLSLISLKAVIEHYSVGNLSVNTTGVTFGGKPLHTTDASRVMAFLKDGLPYQPIANYIEKKLRNTSMRAVNEMYNFLEHQYMPLTPSGNFIAYKGVQKNYYSKMGNTETVVLKGTVDKEGHIYNGIGEEIEILRSCVSDDFRNPCGPGLHAGSLQYASDWAGSDGLVILIEIDPADVVSVPEDCNCQKLRCCKYKVIGEYTGKLPKTYTNEFEPSAPTEDTSKYANDVHKHLKRDANGRFVKASKCGCEEGGCCSDCATDGELKEFSLVGQSPFEEPCGGNCSECNNDDESGFYCCADCESTTCQCDNKSKSKFANDSHKKLGRDANGRFVQKNADYISGYNAAIQDYNDFNEPEFVKGDGKYTNSSPEYVRGYVEGWARSKDANPH